LLPSAALKTGRQKMQIAQVLDVSLVQKEKEERRALLEEPLAALCCHTVLGHNKSSCRPACKQALLRAAGQHSKYGN